MLKQCAASLLGLAMIGPVGAASALTPVTVVVDPSMSAMNVVFSVQSGVGVLETLGVYRAGSPLVLSTKVPSLDDEPLTINAVATEGQSNLSHRYISKSRYRFLPNTLVAVSFPGDFQSLDGAK